MSYHEDAIDFPCSPIWARHYAAKGLTTGYPAELDYQASEPPVSPVPDPCQTLQQCRRYYHLDLPTDKDSMRQELRKLSLLQDDDPWFAERARKLERFIANNAPSQGLPPQDDASRFRRKGIEL